MLCWRRAKNSVGHGSEETGLSRIEIGYRALWEKGCYVNGRNKKKLLGRAGPVVKKCTYDVATCGLRRIWCQDILPVDISSLEMWPPHLDISPLSGHFASLWTFRLSLEISPMDILPHGHLALPGFFSPWTFFPLDILPLRNFVPLIISPRWIFRLLNISFHGQYTKWTFFPWTFRTQTFFSQDITSPGHFFLDTLPLDIFSLDI